MKSMKQVVSSGVFWQKSLLLFITGVFFGLAIVHSVSALSPDQISSYESGIYNFDVDADSSASACGDTEDTSLTADAAVASYFESIGFNNTDSTNLSEVYTYFTSKGLTAAQAAGVVGNFTQESKANPSDGLPNGPSIGIAQWNEPGRWDTLKAFAANQGRNPLDLSLQLDFVWHELNTSYSTALKDLKATTNATDAATEFSNEYEMDGDGPHPTNRINYANGAYGAATGSSTPTSATSSTSTTSSDCSSSTGFSGTVTDSSDEKTIACPSGASSCFNNAVYYSQGTGPWARETFSTNPDYEPGNKDGNTCIDIGCAGCGVTAAAMAIASLTNSTSVNPSTLLPAWQKAGLTDSGGTGWSVSAWNQVANTYGVTVTNLAAHGNLGFTSTELSGIVSALQAGNLVVVSGKDPNSTSGNDTLFTSGGHFVMIRGMTSSGDFLVNDPKDDFTTLQDTSTPWAQSYFGQYGESIWVFSKSS
jgi:hypothetical protein